MRRASWVISVMCLLLTLTVLTACATAPPPADESQADQTAIAPPDPEATREAEARQQAAIEAENARRQYEIERNRFMYEDIFFGPKSYRLDATARTLLDEKALWLQAHPEEQVIIEGHCSEGGSSEDNLALGLRRAGEVKTYLMHQGIDRRRLTAISYGKERPIEAGVGEDAKAKNRRVRLVIVD
jgi:peptidoglycan-associated lipoprotein